MRRSIRDMPSWISGRTVKVASIAAAVLVTLAMGTVPGEAVQERRAPVVVVILAPALSFERVTTDPSLRRLADEGAVGGMLVPQTSLGPAGLDAVRTARALSAGSWGVGAPRLLGEAVSEAGGTTVLLWDSEAARALAGDAEGRVSIQYSPPPGARDEPEVLRSAFASIADRVGDTGRPLFVVVDAGFDLEVDRRGDGGLSVSLPQLASAGVAATAARAALPDATLMVVSNAFPSRDVVGPQPLIIVGDKWKGEIGGTPRRPGLVTLPDVFGGIAGALEIESLSAGGSMRADGAITTSAARIERLGSMSKRLEAGFLARPWVLAAEGVGALLAIVLGASLVLLRARTGRLGLAENLASGALLFSLVMPASNLLAAALLPAEDGAGVLVGVAVVTAVLSLCALGVWRLSGAETALLGMLVVVTAAIAFDQFAGARLSLFATFGYSVLDGVRYYGLGNEGAAVLVSASLLGAGIACDRFRLRSEATVVALAGVLAVGVSVAPGLGANFGVALWGVAAFGLSWVWLTGGRLGWRGVAGVVGVAGALVGALVLVDTFGTSASTHLGETVRSVGAGALDAVWAMVGRKIAMSVDTLTGLPGSLALVVFALFAAVAAFRPPRFIRAALEAHPVTWVGAKSLVVAGAVAVLSEDSGIVMPGIISMYVLGVMVFIALRARQAVRSDVAE